MVEDSDDILPFSQEDWIRYGNVATELVADYPIDTDVENFLNIHDWADEGLALAKN